MQVYGKHKNSGTEMYILAYHMNLIIDPQTERKTLKAKYMNQSLLGMDLIKKGISIGLGDKTQWCNKKNR